MSPYIHSRVVCSDQWMFCMRLSRLVYVPQSHFSWRAVSFMGLHVLLRVNYIQTKMPVFMKSSTWMMLAPASERRLQFRVVEVNSVLLLLQ